jgi:hypothetical protein
MNPKRVFRTPYHQQAITVVLKATKQKIYRHMHCIECGMPFADITDKVLMTFDGDTPISTYEPDKIGLIEVHCPRHQCKQYYKLEMAI